MSAQPPAYRLRRRWAGFTLLTFVAFTGLVTASVGAPPRDDAAAAPAASATIVPQQVLGPQSAATVPRRQYPRVTWRHSRSVGRPFAGGLVKATMLPIEGQHFFTWDPMRNRSPSPSWRRFGTARLIRVLLQVADQFARAHPNAPRLGIGDLSRRGGGRFRGGEHASHQNGLDADIYYPRRDRRERGPRKVSDIDHELAQELVRRFVRAGAQYVFVGPRTRLNGPRGVVMTLRNHDNHMHVRLRRG